VIARDRLNDSEQAIELFSQIFEDEPSDKEAAEALRELYAKSERWQDLAQLLERLLDFADAPSDRSKLHLELAQLNVDHFDATDTAIELYRIVLREEPGQAEAVVKLSELYESAHRDEDLAELLSTQIAAARERSDVDGELRFQVRLGEVYDSRLDDKAKAIETYKSVLERDANHRGALEALARLYQAQNDHAAAAKTLEQLLGMASGDQAIGLSIELADEFEKLKDVESAARALERGLEAQPGHAELRKRLRGYYEAAKSWEKLAELVAGDANYVPTPDAKVALLRQAAEIHGKKRNDTAMAAELLEKASALKPDDRSLMLELCDAYSASGRGKAAAQVLEKIVDSYGGKRVKELGEIHRRLATAYLADGETQRALEELDKAFRIEPGNVTVLKMLGEVAIQAGDAKKAQQMFRALLLQKLDERSPITKAEVFLRLGEVHELLGEKDKAIQMVERAVQTDDKLEAAKIKLLQLKKA
jgi:tetratricopeptide (TPR) repeat protein